MKQIKNILTYLSSYLLVALFFVIAAQPVTAAPPENFQVQQIVGSGLNQPSGFELAPDGRIFILQREGQIRVVKDGVLLDEPFADLPSVASGDRGLIGIALDPEYNINNHYVYFYYTGLDLRNRLVRFDASTDVGQNPLVIYQTNSPSQELHVGGSIRFGPDGKMYFAVGDNGYPPNAQNLSNPHGKILRINKDGSIPVDNPFFGQPGTLPEIWAYGFRNPWRFQFDSATGRMYGGDVGDYSWEEVNRIVKGGNYGWPQAEGMCTAICNSINPLYAYSRLAAGDSVAVTGGPVYRGAMFPEEYQGDYFFGDYGQGFIRKMDLDEAGYNLGVTDFDPNAGTVVDLKVADDGSMYYLNIYPGALYRVTYSTDSSLPVANATADITKGVEPLTVTFSSEGSIDPDGDPITFLWNFGDGTTSTEPNPIKTYNNKGKYTVQLTVYDATDASQAVPLVIQVGQPPVVTIGSPAEGDTYRSGDDITVNAHAIDGAGLDLSDASIKTEVFLHHNTHVHPFVGPFTGRASTFNTEMTEASANVWFEIKVTATDANGLSDTKSVNIYPIKTEMSFTTNIPGLSILLDGSPHMGPHVILGVEKFKREISALTEQIVNGIVYVFDHWSDGGAQRHEITTPEDDTVFTAYYRAANPWNAAYYNNTELQGEPVVTRQEAKIDHIWGEGSPDPAINPDQFSVRWSKEEYFAGGRYRFTTATDDGVRLYVDGALVINHWEGNNASFFTEVDLAPGMHTIIMEYFEGFSLANARLDWDLAQDQPDTVPVTPYDAEYFDNPTLTGEPVVTRQDEAIDFNFGDGSPDPLIPTDGFSARWTKTEQFAAGIYTFAALSDDGVRVYLDDALVIDQWIDQGPTDYEVEIPVTEGVHTVVVEYYENGGGSVIKASYLKIAELPATEGFNAEYFDNQTLTGEPVVTRIDETINFDWSDTSSPDPVVPINQFSARWTKTETFDTAGTYEFSVTADDGFRLFIDGELVLDQWIDQSANTYKVQKALTADEHTIVLEYYEGFGEAIAKLSYGQVEAPPPPTTGVWTGQYFNNMGLGAPVVMTRNDATINFDWGGTSPDPLINANDFSVRWTKLDTFEDAEYKFEVTADDGIRVYVDDELILDKWVNQSPTTYIVRHQMTPGDHTIKVEYFENGGGAVAKVEYSKVGDTPPVADENYTAKYWNKEPGPSPLIPAIEPVLTRLEAEIDHNWGGTSPDPLITENHFIAQWTKNHEFEEDTYVFAATADDGIRVYIDDEPVIDQWNDQSGLTYSVEKEVTAGIHEIRVEYYENWGDAVANFSFAKKTMTTPPPTDAYRARFWNIAETAVPAIPATAPGLERQDAEINFDWAIEGPGEGVNPNFFVAQWEKLATFEDGEYTFATTSDDGIRVFIDDELVLDQWNDHGETVHAAQKVMTAGEHTIRVEYYDKWWTAIAKFSYAKSDTLPTAPTEQPVIASYVFNDDLENDWINWSWDSVVDFASVIAPFSGTQHIKWNPNNHYAGLYFHKDGGFNTAPYKEITFVVRATKANQRLELIAIDDQNVTIGEPLKLVDYGGVAPVGEYIIYVVPLSDLSASNRVINGFHIKDITGETENEIDVDSVGFTAL